MASSRLRALCPHCEVDRAVRGDDRFRPHLRGDEACPSSFKPAPEQPGLTAGEYIARYLGGLSVAEHPARPISKHTDARLLGDIAAGRVWTDGNGRIWRGDRWSRAGFKSHAGPAVRAARDTGWSTGTPRGVEELTGDGKTALAAWDATHDTAVGVVTVR